MSSVRLGPMTRARAALGLATLGLAALAASLVTGCSHRKETPAMEYMPNMAYSPAVKAQNEDPMHPGRAAMRAPVPGTVPRGFTPYRYRAEDSLLAQRELVNPLPRTADVLGRGQRVYMTYCVVCHGPKGDGQGYIVPKFPMPPSLLSPKVSQWPDGRIFHVITLGQNLMPNYASQILPEDRWAVIHYVRALERSAHPEPQDLRAAGIEPDTTGSGVTAAGPGPGANSAPATPSAAGGKP